MQSEQRLDAGVIKDWRETPEGFLDVNITFSKVGSLVYQRGDGTLQTEYLTEEELFNEDSLATATGKPVTWQHPPEWVTKDNARKYARGSTGTKIIKDTPFATILATVHDGELIDIIKSGKAKQVSAGYTTEVVKGDGGKLYQTARRYNHFSVVPQGRAGADVRVHYDQKMIPHTSNSDLIDRVRENLQRDLMVSRLRKGRHFMMPERSEAEARELYISRLKSRKR
jgi:hypothetical protein